MEGKTIKEKKNILTMKQQTLKTDKNHDPRNVSDCIYSIKK